ncbi:hypothetical protein [Caulobacter sp. CCG-8]|uniref:hypothetical protein n=1 Tax=Caulobacter sp. CCG-8 TaxID=3127958 RepID=UPI00307E31D2
MRFPINPQTGVGPLRFGMLRDQVRSVLAVPVEIFRRTPKDVEADLFKSLGAFAYYDGNGALEAVEFFSPAKVTFNELDILNTSASELIGEMSEVDPDLECEGSGFTSRSFGFGVWSEDDSELPPQSVIVFAPGYYESPQR